MKVLALLIGLVVFSNSAKSEVLTVDPKRYMDISGEIRGFTLIYKADKLLDMIDKDPTKPIYLGINSPGGAVLPGIQFISAMRLGQSRGVIFKCFVPTIAASMAFQILSECDERYAFANSVHLWHPIRISASFIQLTPQKLLNIYHRLRSWEKELVLSLKEKLNIDDGVFQYHYIRETLHLGSNLKEISPNFITLITDIQGIPFSFAMSGDRKANEKSLKRLGLTP